MRILVIGSNGFVGSYVRAALVGSHEVFGGVREVGREDDHPLDLLDKASVLKALTDIKPEVVINCAGIVGPPEKVSLNLQMTTNLLTAITESGVAIQRVIISGSAAEYGRIDRAGMAVSETTPTNAEQGYGLSKAQETAFALNFAEQHHLPVTVARIFNPIGRGMNQRQLVPSILRQLKEIEDGKPSDIELSRLDSKRDYIDVRDVARVIKLLAENKTRETVYNVGSGKSTSNQELVQLMIDGSKLLTQPKIIQTLDQPETPVASQADISRLQQEFGWTPIISLKDSIEEIMR